MTDPTSAHSRWLARTNGEDPMSNEELLDRMWEDTFFTSSPGSSVRWVMQELGYRTYQHRIETADL